MDLRDTTRPTYMKQHILDDNTVQKVEPTWLLSHLQIELWCATILIAPLGRFCADISGGLFKAPTCSIRYEHMGTVLQTEERTSLFFLVFANWFSSSSWKCPSLSGEICFLLFLTKLPTHLQQSRGGEEKACCKITTRHLFSTIGCNRRQYVCP